MLRDILNNVQQCFAELVPPGISAIAASPGATGVVTVDASSAALGSFKALVKVVVGGPLGTAQVQVALDGRNFDSPVTLPVSGLLPLQLPEMSPGLVSQVLSGLALSCSGNFTNGDTYSFTANAAVTFLFGKDQEASQDSLFPRVVWLPAGDDFEGTEDWAAGATNQPRSLVTAAGRFETRCWGIDYDRAELLMQQVVNAVNFSLRADARFTNNEWAEAAIGDAGRLCKLYWRTRRPVPDLSGQWTLSPPPHTAVLTATHVDTQ